MMFSRHWNVDACTSISKKQNPKEDYDLGIFKKIRH